MSRRPNLPPPPPSQYRFKTNPYDVSKGGRGCRTFPTGQDIFFAAKAYVEWCEANPVMVPQTVYNPTTKDGETYYEPRIRPPTIAGFAAHYGFTKRKLLKWMQSSDEEFADGAELAHNLITSHLLEGGLVGAFQPSIVSRLTGLADNVNVDLPPPPPEAQRKPLEFTVVPIERGTYLDPATDDEALPSQVIEGELLPSQPGDTD